MNGKIKVLVVDDSPTMRQIVTRVLEEDPEIDVVGSAKSAHQARELIKMGKQVSRVYFGEHYDVVKDL
jgi:two-component system chemotaxis response regulator CheB